MNILSENGIDVVERIANVTELMDQLNLSAIVLARRAGEVAEASQPGDEERAVELLNAASVAAERMMGLQALLQLSGCTMLHIPMDDGSGGMVN